MKINKNKSKDSDKGEKENKLILYKSVRILVYCLLLLSIILISISSGIFPSSSIEIKNNLHISNYYYGLFFFNSSIGKIIGTLLYFQLKKLYNRKLLLLLSTLINSIIFFIFSYSDNFWIISVLRGVGGITDMVLHMFIPEWIDQFGINKYKLCMISIIQFSNPLGKSLAFFINYFCTYLAIFKFEAIIFSVLFFVFIFIPNKYSAKNIVILVENETGKEMIDTRWEKDIAIYTLDDEEKEKAIPLVDKSNNNNLDESKDDININLNIDNFSQQNGNHKIIHSHQIPFLEKIKIILGNKIFILALNMRIILIGIETSITLWMPDIIIKSIEIQKTSYYNLLGNILIIITPPLGNFITRIMGQFTIIGNKRKRKTVILLIFFYILSILVSILIPNNKSFSTITTIIIFLFCSSTCLPMLQGICLSSTNKKVKENILTVIHILTLLFGSGIYPFVFGFVYDKFEKDEIPMVRYFLFINLGIGFVLLPLLIYFIYRKDFKDLDRNSSIRNSGFSIDMSSKDGKKDIMEELGNAYGEEIPDNLKNKKKTKLKSIDI